MLSSPWGVELLSEMMVKEALNILSICKFVSSVSLLLFVTLCRWVRPRTGDCALEQLLTQCRILRPMWRARYIRGSPAWVWMVLTARNFFLMLNGRLASSNIHELVLTLQSKGAQFLWHSFFRCLEDHHVGETLLLCQYF